MVEGWGMDLAEFETPGSWLITLSQILGQAPVSDFCARVVNVLNFREKREALAKIVEVPYINRAAGFVRNT